MLFIERVQQTFHLYSFKESIFLYVKDVVFYLLKHFFVHGIYMTNIENAPSCLNTDYGKVDKNKYVYEITQ